jgi:hypothetical protein
MIEVVCIVIADDLLASWTATLDEAEVSNVTGR